MSRARTESPEIFVDREEALCVMRRSFEEMVSSGKGSAIFVSGEPGIGKTSLITTYLKEINKDEVAILQTAGREFATSPYMALFEMFEPILQPRTMVKEGKLIALTLMNIGRLIPVFGNFVGVATDAFKDLRGLSETDSKIISNSFYVRYLFMSFFEKVSRKKPIIAFFDDVQWFDASSLEVLGFLIEKVSRFPAVLVICLRKGYPESEREQDNSEIIEGMMSKAGTDKVTVLTLSSFPQQVSLEMIKLLLRSDKIDQDQVDFLVKRTAGNPFLIDRTVKDLLDSGVLTSSQDRWHISGDLTKIIPRTVSDVLHKLLVRIQKEDADARLALDYAAVLGERFNIQELARIIPSDPLKTKHMFEKLESIYGIVHLADQEDMYEFDHSMTRDAILSHLGPLAQQVHLRTAELYRDYPSLSPSVAFHYQAAGKYDLAFEYYKKAAEDSSKSYSFADAINYLEKCKVLIETRKVSVSRDSLIKLLLVLANNQFSNGKFDASFSTVSSIIGMERIPTRLKAEAYLLAGRSCRYIGTTDAGTKGIQYLKKAAALFQEVDEQQKLGTTFSVLSTVLDHFGNHEESVSCYSKSQRALNLAKDQTGLALLARKSGMIYDSRRAIRFIEEAMKTFKKTNATIEQGRCLNNLGAENFYLGDFASARLNLLQSVETYGRIDSYEVDAPLNNLGIVSTQTGNLHEASEFLIESQRKVSEDFNRICVSVNLAILDRLNNKHEEEFHKLSELIPLVEKSGEPLIQDYFGFNLSSALLELGKSKEALRWLEKYPPNTWKGDIELVRAKRLKLNAKILSELGQIEEATRTTKEYVEIFATKRPQKWFYELDYYPCDIHILD